MRLAPVLSLGLSLSLLACGSANKKTSGGGAASSASYFSVSDGLCVLVTPTPNWTAAELENANATAEEDNRTPFKSGSCPTTVTVGTAKATVVKTCDEITEEEEDKKIISRTTVYSKMTTEDGVITVTSAMATSICESVANPDEQTEESTGEEETSE